jgi:hypothetical protein
MTSLNFWRAGDTIPVAAIDAEQFEQAAAECDFRTYQGGVRGLKLLDIARAAEALGHKHAANICQAVYREVGACGEAVVRHTDGRAWCPTHVEVEPESPEVPWNPNDDPELAAQEAAIAAEFSTSRSST